MSALAKPLFFFAGATGSDVDKTVNADYIYDMSKEDTQVSVTNATVVPTIKIIYIYPSNPGVREVVYKFDTVAHRNTSFTNLKAAICATGIANT